ncbi:CUB domain-containing protein 1 [Spea bombifrons]|uniref:CUB domain-containing protein 1 n=1 Tax=Spea bombifrons TaxID=233779 RepID=UPI00234AADAE|nr:CUB domain-containing protein 1 [Spea bombifrons]
MGHRDAAMLLVGILFTWLLPQMTESIDISIQPKDNITITIKPASTRPVSPSCFICTKKDGCKLSTLWIGPGMTVGYTFSCPSPEKYFVMEILNKIDCNSGSCPFGNVVLQPASLTGLNRTFSWHVATAQNIGLVLSFSTPWLKQIDSSMKCPDLVTYTIGTFVSGSSTSIGTFCSNGTVSRIKLQGGGVVTLELPWNETLTESGFSIANRSSIRRLCIIESTFQRESMITMMSANYPKGFPNDELMMWQFAIPPDHRASVQFLNYTLPNCLRKEERVEYELASFHNNPEVYKLQGNQPANIPGNFNMSLYNCDMDNLNPSALTLVFSVTVQKTPNEANKTYHIDLRRDNDMNVRISKRPISGRQFVRLCLICQGQTDCGTELNLAGGRYYRIYFLCENLDSLMVTAESVIACSDIKTCTIKDRNLAIHPSLVHLPVRLETITWKLIPPPNSSTEIGSKSLKLHQPLPGQTCNATTTAFEYGIASSTQEDQFKIGTFCPNGSVEKIQMKGNVTIILSTRKYANTSHILIHDLYASFVTRLREEVYFTVSPKTGSTTHLHTPNWEEGLPDYVSLSWNIELATNQFAKLTFDREKIGIMCQMNSALLRVREKKANGINIVTKEDEKLPRTLDLYNPFWVNISNCKPKGRDNKLQIQFTITTDYSSSDTKIIAIAAAAAAGAVIIAIVVALCCIRKKKKEKETPLGIYNSKVNTEIPRRQGFLRKGRKKESHIYAVIDDTMVYGHLLKNTNGPSNPEVDVYRSFEGNMSDPPPPPVPPLLSSNGSTKEDHWQDPLALSMTQNELYTFSETIPKVPVEDEDTSLSFLDYQGNGNVPSV